MDGRLENRIEELKQEIEVPEVVLDRAEHAFRKIRRQTEMQRRRGKKRFSQRRLAIIAAAAVLAVGTVSVGAAVYSNWSKSMGAMSRGDEKLEQNLDKNGMSKMIEAKADAEGQQGDKTAEAVRADAQTDKAADVAAANVGTDVANAGTNGANDGTDVAETGTDVAETGDAAESGAQAAAFEKLTDTQAGVTISLKQTIVDGYYGHLVFKVEGYTPEAGMQPWIEKTEVLIDGKPGYPETADDNLPDEERFGTIGNFYDSIIAGPDGSAMYADGTPISDQGGGLVGKYVQEDGTLEFNVDLSNPRTKGFFIGKRIAVKLVNLGTIGKTDFTTDIDAEWNFEWTLDGADAGEEFDVGVPLGDTGITVKKIELSPISVKAIFEGNIFASRMDGAPFWPDTVLYKDGRIVTGLYLGPGTTGRSEDGSESSIAFPVDRILDVDQIEGMLFPKELRGGSEKALEDYYIVPLRGTQE